MKLNQIEKYEIAIVGAGPAGCAAAIEAMNCGFSNVIMLDKDSPSRLKPCAGGLSMKAEKLLSEYPFSEELFSFCQKIESARMVFPAGKELTVSGEASASVVNRQKFDAYLLQRAKKAGVNFLPNCKVIGIEKRNEREVVVSYQTKNLKEIKIETQMVIIASGAHSKFNNDLRPKTRITSCTAWYKGGDFNPSELEMVFDKELLPHYGWLFPESAESCNIGMCLYLDKLKGKSVLDVYQDFFNRHFNEKMKNAVEVISPRVHSILPASPSKFYPIPGSLLTGDAAGLIDAFTGEGISAALYSGKEAARAIYNGFKNDETMDQISKKYEKTIRAELGSSIRKGFMLTKVAKPLLLSSEIFLRFAPVRNLLSKQLSKI